MSSGKDREGDLWDDSVLIEAFNDSISKYKKMHNMQQKISPGGAGKANSCIEDPANLVDAHDAERYADINSENPIASNSKDEIDETGNKSTVKESSCLEAEASDNHFNSSDGKYFEHEPTVHPNSQGPEDYNQLLNKYYELEDQRQKVLQQLNQFGYGNYNFESGIATSEHHQTSASQAHWGLTGSACPYGCQSWITCCSSEPSCCFSKDYPKKSYAPAEAACSKESVSLEDTDIVKTAKAVAERALSSLKEQVSNNSEACVNEGQEKQSETHGGSETDLSMLLNAWYNAGFYTGKYVSEHSLEKNRRS